MERRLGRGLDSLLGGGAPAETKQAAETSGPPEGAGIRVPIQQVRPNPNQPRKVFDSARLEELRDSIRRHGVLQPICVRRVASGYEIVAGERRWRASRLAGLQEIPAVVLEDVEDRGMLELALVENVQRQDLDPIEKARAFHEMVERLGMTQEQVAERVGLARASVANHIRLLELPQEAQEAVAAGALTMGHARALLGLTDDAALRRLLARTVREDLSVRQVEEVVRERKASRSGARGKTPAKAAGKEPWSLELEGRLREALGARAEVRNGPEYRGQIVLHYHDREELERLIEVLAPKPTL